MPNSYSTGPSDKFVVGLSPVLLPILEQTSAPNWSLAYHAYPICLPFTDFSMNYRFIWPVSMLALYSIRSPDNRMALVHFGSRHSSSVYSCCFSNLSLYKDGPYRVFEPTSAPNWSLAYHAYPICLPFTDFSMNYRFIWPVSMLALYSIRSPDNRIALVHFGSRHSSSATCLYLHPNQHSPFCFNKIAILEDVPWDSVLVWLLMVSNKVTGYLYMLISLVY